jgi:uncharacterized membrane protein YphA (DoxX/SURF4 family)
MAQSQTITRGEAPRPLIAGRFGPLRGDLREPRFQAYLLLWVGFTVAPLLFGVDKFFNWMTYWPNYLWVGFPHLFGHVSSLHFMYAVGVVEMTAGLLVLLLPRFAPYVIAAWLGGIITNLVIISAVRGGHTNVYWDIALRDFGLLIAALALARLGAVYAPNPLRRRVVHGRRAPRAAGVRDVGRPTAPDGRSRVA